MPVRPKRSSPTWISWSRVSRTCGCGHDAAGTAAAPDRRPPRKRPAVPGCRTAATGAGWRRRRSWRAVQRPLHPTARRSRIRHEQLGRARTTRPRSRGAHRRSTAERRGRQHARRRARRRRSRADGATAAEAARPGGCTARSCSAVAPASPAAVSRGDGRRRTLHGHVSPLQWLHPVPPPRAQPVRHGWNRAAPCICRRCARHLDDTVRRLRCAPGRHPAPSVAPGPHRHCGRRPGRSMPFATGRSVTSRGGARGTARARRSGRWTAVTSPASGDIPTEAGLHGQPAESHGDPRSSRTGRPRRRRRRPSWRRPRAALSAAGHRTKLTTGDVAGRRRRRRRRLSYRRWANKIEPSPTPRRPLRTNSSCPAPVAGPGGDPG
ncbi:hypothetical protein STANM309S_02274 [Streptomyces tanashiensis]